MRVRKERVRGFGLLDKDYAMLTDYAYRNRISATEAVRYLIRTNCGAGTPTGRRSGVLLSPDIEQAVRGVVSQLPHSPGRRNEGETFTRVVNQLIRRGLAKSCGASQQSGVLLNPDVDQAIRGMILRMPHGPGRRNEGELFNHIVNQMVIRGIEWAKKIPHRRGVAKL
jgi:hypothetical protein